MIFSPRVIPYLTKRAKTSLTFTWILHYMEGYCKKIEMIKTTIKGWPSKPQMGCGLTYRDTPAQLLSMAVKVLIRSFMNIWNVFTFREQYSTTNGWTISLLWGSVMILRSGCRPLHRYMVFL